MTCKEKYILKHPDIEFDAYSADIGCPDLHGYLYQPSHCCSEPNSCEKCWNREIPEEKEKEENMTELKPCTLCGEKPGEVHLCGGIPTLTHTCINDVEMRIRSVTKNGVTRKWNSFVTVTGRTEVNKECDLIRV